jgi:lysophospholipid acyltransferase (LPLAT)-like uncharacterized protein
MSAIRESVRTLKQGKSLIITVDGPRGPRRKVKKGISQIASLSQMPVVPVCIVPNRFFRLTSWDKFIVPLPFTAIDMFFADPLLPESASLEEPAIEALTGKIEQSLMSRKERTGE